MVKLIFKCSDCSNQAEVSKADEDLTDAAVPFCPRHNKAMRVLNIEFKKKDVITRRKVASENIQ
jgi:hypothetical protein